MFPGKAGVTTCFFIFYFFFLEIFVVISFEFLLSFGLRNSLVSSEIRANCDDFLSTQNILVMTSPRFHSTCNEFLQLFAIVLAQVPLEVYFVIF